MGIKQIDLNTVVSNEFQINDDIVINGKCKYGDDIWDFTDTSNIRKNAVNDSKLKFNWEGIMLRIGKKITEELKILTYFILFAPSIFGKSNTNKVNTVHYAILTLVYVIEKIQIDYQEKSGINSLNFIENIGDIKINDLKAVVIPPSNVNTIKLTLTYLSNPLLQKYLLNPVKWNEYDIKKIKFITSSKNTNQENSAKPIDEKLYIEMIKKFTTDIVSFKNAMKMSVYSSITSNIQNSLEKKTYSYDVASAFEDYVEIREIEKMNAVKSGKRNNTTGKQRESFKHNHEITLNDFYHDLLKIQRACFFAILTFTGIRYSELISLKASCIVKRKDVYVLKGTITKHQDNLLPTNEDEWVAIPIVRDAIEILEAFQRFTFNSFLVSSLHSVYLNQKDIPYSLSGITEALNKYVNQPENKITVHRLRHSLAQQLIRGKLGLPYISYHLKHVNSAVVAYNRVNNVTLGYGGISKEITHSVKYFHAAKKELINEIYHPNSSVAGGKNAIEFTKRKKEYFQGLMVNDEEIEDIIDDLKCQSLPFLDVGLGYCAGRKDIELKDGSKQPPPCIGQLKCNPVDCGNAVIPKSKLPIWKKVYNDTINKLNDEEFSYMKLELKETLNRAEYVINHFRDNEGVIIDADDTY